MNYYNELPVNTFDDETALAILGIFLAILGVVLVFCVVCWVLSSLSLHSIAKRRGIRNPWLAWIPVGSSWILGSVSDQYQHLVKGKVTSRRKILLILTAATTALCIFYMVLAVISEIMVVTGEAFPESMLLVLIPYFLTIGTGIALAVFYYMCNFDLYSSCKPDNAVLFLVLSIIIPVCQPFFYLACRKKDLGMVVPQPEMPTYTELPKVDPEF